MDASTRIGSKTPRSWTASPRITGSKSGTFVAHAYSEKAIVDFVHDGYSFHERRHIAVSRPERARDKLGGYAMLKIKILQARNLLIADLSGSSDPYTEVYVDDVLKGQTDFVFQDLNPVWNWEPEDGGIPIKNPASVVLLRVMDYDFGSGDDVLGFVEFPVSDMPLGRRIDGWFVLAPGDRLTGVAPERLKQMLTAERPEECGAVYLELELSIVSDEPSDEQYAWCLPPPKFWRYPEEGTVMNVVGMQNVVDKIMDLRTAILFLIVNPVLSFIVYILSWREPLLSSVVFLTAVLISARPYLYLTGVFGLVWFCMLTLKDPVRRRRIDAHPRTVAVDEEGFELVAGMQNTEKTAIFISRVIAQMHGSVVDSDRLREFAAFATLEGLPVTPLAGLREQLESAALNANPFVKFKNEALPERSLVMSRTVPGFDGDIAKGEIVQVLESYENNTWRYLVKYRYRGKWQEPIEQMSDEIEIRPDLRWMSSPAVLNLIPSNVTNIIQSIMPIAENNIKMLRNLNHIVYDLISWKYLRRSTCFCWSCLVFSILCIWIQKVVLIAAVFILFVLNTTYWRSCCNRRRARAQAREHAEKKWWKWGFLIDAAESVVNSPRMSESPNSSRRTNMSCFSMGFLDCLGNREKQQ